MTQSLENKAETAPEMRQSGLIEIFLSFGMIGFLSFGGVGPWVRWLLVERKGWYSEAEFVNTFALANFIPGGNVVALATIAGAKLRGWPGSLMAITGLCLPPAILVCAAGSLYLAYRDTAIAQNILGAMAAAGAGLIAGMGIKLLKPMRNSPSGLAMTAMVFLAAYGFGLPLVMVLLTLGPISLILALWLKR
ncbi:chromate transporter [Paracoccus pantotrophus]|uniref:Putative chromate transport protein ChrA n=1 Tax=Paracoccus pantotrophus TaxID=82367 RepID=Q3S8F2_PARPN|nr:chromate transporter [Paracoccus pantotrophus]AAZ93593.1 putative chromate transport protein ChrA [Paracoccus pantotrophus]RDD96929.1 chromate transporter [Paracoccus pantotrophus]WGR66598.1 chromate transporter [Paracoccus pantotrophus]